MANEALSTEVCLCHMLLPDYRPCPVCKARQAQEAGERVDVEATIAHARAKLAGDGKVIEQGFHEIEADAGRALRRLFAMATSKDGAEVVKRSIFEHVSKLLGDDEE